MKNRLTALFLSAVLLLCGCSKDNTYAEAEKIALDYINNVLGIEGEIIDTEYYCYDYGITGGLRQYLFTFVDSDGKTSKYYYHSYYDITETELNEKIFTLEE